MRILVLDRTIRTALVASAALLLAACGHNGASNDSNGSGGGGGGGSDAASGTDNGTSNAELGDNDMDSNLAQTDAANGTTVGSPAKAAGNGTQ